MLKSAHVIARGHRLFLTAAFSLAVLGAALLFAITVEAQEAGDSVVEERAPLTATELEALVGPIALYPDDLVSIVLPASTYPLQIVQAARYLKDHETDPTLKPNENWDDSVMALLNYPEVIELMNDDLDWTRALGDAAVYQQTALLDAIQDFRERAYAAGNLKSDERQVVTKNQEIIVIEPADPKVIYVPYYEPDYVVVRHVYPVYRYYPRPYPVYYYPYPYGHSFHSGFFWGVTLAFIVDWHSHHVHVRHHHHHAHPYYGRYFHFPYYRRHTVRVSYRDQIWRPRHHHRFRHKHAVARVKANRRIDAALAHRAPHRKHGDHRFRAPGHNSTKRAHGPNRNSRGRDKGAFRTREHADSRKHLRQGRGDISRRSDTVAGPRKIGPRAERPRTHRSQPRDQRAHRSGGFRSNDSSRSRPKWSNAPRHRIEQSAIAKRSAPIRRGRVGSGSHGNRTFKGTPKHGRPDFGPRSGGRFKSETRSRSGGRSGFGGGSRRHLR